MGEKKGVEDMLDFVVKNNQSYYTTYVKHKFDDQFAIADYSIKVNPSEVALDYHQQFAASCSIHTVGDKPDEGWPFVCKGRDSKLNLSCQDWTKKLIRFGHFKLNETSCLPYRNIYPALPEREEIESLATDPVIWHGNGAGKSAFLGLAHHTFHCRLKKANMTENDWMNTYG